MKGLGPGFVQGSYPTGRSDSSPPVEFLPPDLAIAFLPLRFRLLFGLPLP